MTKILLAISLFTNLLFTVSFFMSLNTYDEYVPPIVEYISTEEGTKIEPKKELINPVQLEYRPKNLKDFGGGWYVSNYYFPVPGQLSYVENYQYDLNMNCGGDCTHTADMTQLTDKDKFKYVACPPELDFGTRLRITMPEDYCPLPEKNDPDCKKYNGKSWIVECVDRGSAIVNKHIDLFVGVGQQGKPHPWIGELSTREAKVEIVQ